MRHTFWSWCPCPPCPTIIVWAKICSLTSMTIKSIGSLVEFLFSARGHDNRHDKKVVVPFYLLTSYDNGLPASLFEVKIIERTRQKRLFDEMLPPSTDEFSFGTRARLLEAQELKEWAERLRQSQQKFPLHLRTLCNFREGIKR